MTDLERALLHIKTRADAWAVREVEKALSQEPCRKDCRLCKEFDECENGKKGHKNGTSIGYSIGECKDYEPCTDAVSVER